MKTFAQYILPAILIFLGGLIGAYLTSSFNHNEWQERISYERQIKLFEKRLQLLERTTAITGKLPSTNDLFKLYFAKLSDTTIQDKTEKNEEINLAEKLGEIRAEFRSVMFLNQIYFGDSTKSKIKRYLIRDKKYTWWNLPEEKYNEIIESMSNDININPISSISANLNPTKQMSDVSKILWTAIATLIGGIIIYVVGRAIEKFVLEPLQDYRKTLGKIADTLTFYANIYSNTSVASNDEKKEVSKELRKLASDLSAKTHHVPFYPIFSKFKAIPSYNNSIDASSTLIGFSNSLWHSSFEELDARRKRIEKLLNIKT